MLDILYANDITQNLLNLRSALVVSVLFLHCANKGMIAMIICSALAISCSSALIASTNIDRENDAGSKNNDDDAVVNNQGHVHMKMKKTRKSYSKEAQGKLQDFLQRRDTLYVTTLKSECIA